MNKILGVLAAAVVGVTMGGAARACDWCDCRHDDCHSCDDHCGYHDDYRGYGDHAAYRARLGQSDCGDFSYRDWLPRRHTYVFWSPSDRGWYYWCSTSASYLPYGQIDAHPPVAALVPDMPKGLPPVVPGGVDRDLKDQMPPVPPDDGPAVVKPAN